MSKILLIDDDTELCALLEEYLASEGFEVIAVHDGEEGVRYGTSSEYVLIVLDVMLPKMNGFEVLQRIRAVSSTPVVMLTARGEEVDRIVGLEMGADDYLPKPFNPRELVARVRAVLRRYRPEETSTEHAPPAPERLEIGDLVMEPGTRTVWQHGEAVALTGVEFGFLEMLLRSAGQVVHRGDLAREVLGREPAPFDRSIDVHVSSLRKKLGHHVGETERIKTVRGVGYLYARTAGRDDPDDSPPR